MFIFFVFIIGAVIFAKAMSRVIDALCEADTKTKNKDQHK